MSDALDRRRETLEALGFVVVEHLEDGFLAMRRKWHMDVFSRLTTLVRVRRADSLTRAEMLAGDHELQLAFKQHDTGRIPRGFQHGWVLIDAWVVDQPEADAVQYARSKVGKGYARTWHPVILTPGGAQYVASALFGRAYWPKTHQIIQALETGEVGPEPSSGLGVFAGLVMAANVVIVSLMCCGLPVLGWFGLTALESEIRPAVEG